MLSDGNISRFDISKQLNVPSKFVYSISTGRTRLSISSQYDWKCLVYDGHKKLIGENKHMTEIVRKRKKEYLKSIDKSEPYIS